ncbi:MAG: hypothetical protein L0J79_09035 [Propionibacterium sp.]|nr:hypothetical protein [Propionibacterium sp.]
MDTPTTSTPSRFGLTRRGRIPTLRVAMPLGLLLAVVFGVARVVLVNPDGPYKWVAGVILGLCVSPCLMGLVWVLCVDRSTLTGAIPNPEASVESTWYSQASTDAFHVILASSGLGAALVQAWAPPQVSWTLIAVFVVATFSFGLSYLIRRSR